MAWVAGIGRALSRSTLIVLLLSFLAVPWPAVSQPARPGDVVTEARKAAVPLGESAMVGSLRISVTGFNPDASAFEEGPETTALPGDNERFIIVTLELDNTGDVEVEFSADMELNLRFAGNQGILGPRASFDYCEVENDMHSRETPSLAPGESREVNVCTKVLVEDIPSLQMLATMEPGFDADVSSAEEVESGTWFDLGADRPFDEGVAAEQVRVAMLVAPEGPASLSEPDVTVTRNETFVVELLDYLPDVTDEITGDESWHYQRPTSGEVYVSASMRVTNVGDRPASFHPILMAEDGVGSGGGVHSRLYEHEMGMLLPGGSSLWTGQWSMPEEGSRALVVTTLGVPEAGMSWMLLDPAEPFAWEAPEVSPAPPAEMDDPELAVPPGDEAAVGGFNVSLTRSPELDDDRYRGHTMTVTYTGDSVSEVIEWWSVTITPEPAGCLSRGGGSLYLPGASTIMEIRCPVAFDTSTPLRLDIGIAGTPAGEEPRGLFAREPEE